MTERAGRRLAKGARLVVCAVAVLSTTVSCSPNLTTLARQGRIREVCTALGDARSQLVRATDPRLSFDVVPHALLAAEAGAELRGEPGAVALRAKITQDPAAPFHVGIVDMAFSSRDRVDVPLAYGLPPMPHRERVLAQGRGGEDANARTFAVLGHLMTGGAALLIWKLAGRDPKELVPDVREVPEPQLSEQEEADIARWASRRDVRYFLELDSAPARGRSALVRFFPPGWGPNAGARFGPGSHLSFTLAFSYDAEPGCYTQLRGSLLLSKRRSTESALPAYVPQRFEDDVSVLVGRGVIRLAEHPELFDLR